MTTNLSLSVVFALLITAIVLMLNPAPLAFAAHGGPNSEHEGSLQLQIPTCDADPQDPDDVQAFLVELDGNGNPVGGIDTTSFSFTFVPSQNAKLDMLVFDETWTSEDRSYIVICGLAANTAYQVKKTITHDVADDPILGPSIFPIFDNELLDPCCSQNDDELDQAAEAFVPIGFSQSNNVDGLSFTMEDNVDRSSTTWNDFLADEFSEIDFLNFRDGTLVQGETDDFMTFVLKEKQGGAENPFLLVEKPNFPREVCPPFCPPVGGELNPGTIVTSPKISTNPSTPSDSEKLTSPVTEEQQATDIESQPSTVPEEQQPTDTGGGCLIATATFGSELAPQVQQLREIRDNSLLQTQSGSSFMTRFNEMYCSLSPTIADLERQSPIFKEVVKLSITPLISSLSILNYVNMDSEAKVLGYGIGLILLNVGMYIVAPVGIGIVIARKF